MLMIRFQRIGRKNDAAFRMVVLEKTAGPKAGSYVDLVGTYNPKTKQVTVKPDAIRAWIGKGAQVSPSLHNLLVKEGVLQGEKFSVVSKKNLEKNQGKEEPAKAPVAGPEGEEQVDETPDAAAEEVTVDATLDVEQEAEEAPAEEPPADDTKKDEEAKVE